MPEPGSHLPFDVLVDVMETSSSQAVYSLMLTCRALYTQGPKHLLLSGVALRDPYDVIAFVQFMLTGDPARFSFLRELSICFGELGSLDSRRRKSVDWTQNLVKLLEHPRLSLRVLVLEDAEAFLHAEHTFLPAICNLSTLERLVVWNGGARTAFLLQHMSATLVRADIAITSTLRNPVPVTQVQGVIRCWHPLFLLSRSCDSLQELSWTQADERFSPLACSIPHTAHMPVYPKLKRFSLVHMADSRHSEHATPRIAPFVRAFPNLSSFAMTNFPSTCPRISSSNIDLPAYTSGNVFSNNYSNIVEFRRPEYYAGVWPGLSECRGDLQSLSSLGLPPIVQGERAVNTLHVKHYYPTPEHAVLMGMALSDLRPTSLSVRVNGWDALSGRDGLLPCIEHSETLRHLSLDLSLPTRDLTTECDPDAEQEDISVMENVASALEVLPSTLTRLCLRLGRLPGGSFSDEALSFLSERISIGHPSLESVRCCMSMKCP